MAEIEKWRILPDSDTSTHSLREIDLRHPGLVAVAKTVHESCTDYVFRHGRDPIVILETERGDIRTTISLRLNEVTEGSTSSYTLQTNSSEISISDIQNQRLPIHSMQILGLSRYDSLVPLSPFSSSADERLTLSGTRQLTELNLWDSQTMNILKGLPLIVGRTHADPRKRQFMQENSGVFAGIIESNQGKPESIFKIGTGRIFNTGQPIEFIAPLVVCDRYDSEGPSTALGRYVEGIKTFLTNFATQGATVSITTDDETVVGIFKNLSGRNAILETPRGIRQFQCANAGVFSQIKSVEILSPDQKQLPYGDAYLLTPIYRSENYREPVRRILENHWDSTFDLK